MRERGIDRLIAKAGIEIDSGRRFAAVPHDGAIEDDVGRWQWPAVHRQHADSLGRRLLDDTGGRIGVATVRVLDRRDGEFGGGRDGETDADQAVLYQQPIGFLFFAQRRDIVAGAGGAVDQAEDRIRAGAVLEPLGDIVRAHAPAVLRLMAGEAGPPISSQILEEGVVRRDGRAARLV